MPNWKKVIVSGSNAILNNITASGNFSALNGGVTIDAGLDAELIVQGQISASGLLFASLSYDSTPVTNGVVVYDTSSGRFYYTGSYGGSGGGDDNDWYINNGTLGQINDFVTSSRFVKVDHQGLFINSGSIASQWGFGSHYKNSVVGSKTPGAQAYNNASTATPGGYTGKVAKGIRTYATAESWTEYPTAIYPVCLTGKPSDGFNPYGLNEGYPYNYLVFNQGFSYAVLDPNDDGGGPPHPDGGGDGVPNDDNPGGMLIVHGGIELVDYSNKVLSSPSESIQIPTGSGQAPPATIIRPQGGILFFETGSTLTSSGSYLATSASARLGFSTSSKHLSIQIGTVAANDLKEVMFISKSGDNPRIGIGVDNPLKAFDFKEVSDTTRGGELLIRGSRTTKGAEANDEVGRINFAIDSSSFEKIDTSGSAAEIVAIVDDIDTTGVEGSLSLRVAEGKTAAPRQILKIIGDASLAKTVEVTGSAEFSKNITVKEDLIIEGKIDSFITASSGISASGDIKATNFLLPTNGGSFKLRNNASAITLDSDNIDLGFGSSWQLEIRKNEGVILYEYANVSDSLSRDFRIEGTNDSHLLFVSGHNNTVGIGTSIPDEKLTVNGNIKALGDIIATGNIIAQQYIVSSSVTYMTQSFSSGSTIFGDTQDDTHQFTGSVDITGSFTVDGITFPIADGDNGDVLITDGLGNLSFTRTTVYANVKNVSGVDLAKGYPVHVTGTSGNASEIIVASASNSATMPAHFILNEAITNGSEGQAIAIGFINGVNTSGFNEGDTIYVAPNGGYTNSKPTGSNLIQNLGIVTKIDASNGSGYVLGAGRSNDVPNITSGYAWVGNSDQVATAVATSSFVVTTSNTASYVAAANIDGIIDISDQTNLAGGTNLTLSGDTMNLDANISLTSVTASGNISASGTIVGTTGSFDVINLDRLSLTSTQTTVPPLQLTANSLQDGVGALRIDGSQADIFLNPSTATHTTVTFAVNDDQRLAFGMDNNSDFYITRRTGGTWYDDTFVLDRDTGKVSLGYGLSVTGNITASGNISASGTITANGATFTGNLIVTGSQLITDDITSGGTIRARVKSFDIPHPTRKNKRLVYGALEGPEHGIYCRGESKELKVLLPPEWRAMVDTKGVSVQITPIGEWQPLYFKKLHSNWLYFGCGDDRENVHFYWEIKGERTDVPKLETVQ